MASGRVEAPRWVAVMEEKKPKKNPTRSHESTSLLARQRRVKSGLAITRLHSGAEDSWRLDAPRLSPRLNSSHADEAHRFSSFRPACRVINSFPPSPPLDAFDVVRFELKAFSQQLTNEYTAAVVQFLSRLYRLQMWIYGQDMCNNAIMKKKKVT